MAKNTGKTFEKEVYKLISEIVRKNEFMVSNPNVKIRRKPRYYSKDRDAEIEFDISVEKYLGNPDENKNMKPSIIVVIECKDYSGSIPVDDVEEFHAKLQQVGADNTKGMIITQMGNFQKSALSYAESKGIALARILPSNQIDYALCCPINSIQMKIENKERCIAALTEKKYKSKSMARNFYSLAGDYCLEECIFRIIGINYRKYLKSKFKKEKELEENLKKSEFIDQKKHCDTLTRIKMGVSGWLKSVFK